MTVNRTLGRNHSLRTPARPAGHTKRVPLAAALAIGLAGPALAQTAAPEDWSYEQLYERGLSASQLMERVRVVATPQEAEGSAEEGTVFDLVIGLDGELLSTIVRLGGLMDIGERYVNVPWDEATLENGQLEVSISANAITEHPIFPDAAITARQAGTDTTDVGDEVNVVRAFKATELLGDYVRLEDHTTFGYTEDLIFDRDGSLLAVVVAADPRYGGDQLRAFPYHGFGEEFRPGDAFYDLPYTENEAVLFDQFDLQNLSEGEQISP